MSRRSAACPVLAHVASVATQVAPVLPRVPHVAREVATVLLQLTRVALQLVPAREHRGSVARGLRAGDGVPVVRDLLPVADDLPSVLPHLVPVGPHLPVVAAHLDARMRGLSGQGAGSAEGRDGARGVNVRRRREASVIRITSCAGERGRAY